MWESISFPAPPVKPESVNGYEHAGDPRRNSWTPGEGPSSFLAGSDEDAGAVLPKRCSVHLHQPFITPPPEKQKFLQTKCTDG